MNKQVFNVNNAAESLQHRAPVRFFLQCDCYLLSQPADCFFGRFIRLMYQVHSWVRQLKKANQNNVFEKKKKKWN